MCTFEEAWAFAQENKCIVACCAAVTATGSAATFPYLVAGPVLNLAGFATGGILKGSLAAAWHSTIGNAVAPGLFSTLQSAGAMGYGASAVGGAVSAAASGATGAVIYYCAKMCGAEDVVEKLSETGLAVA